MPETHEYLRQIVTDYTTNVEPVLIKHGAGPAGQAAVRAFESRWPRQDIRAAMDAFAAAHAIRTGTGIAQAIANLGR